MGAFSSRKQPFVYAVQQDLPHSPNSTPILRHPKAVDGLIANFDPPYSSLYQVFKTACMRYPMNMCLGEQQHHIDGNKYEWLSYSEVDRLVKRAGNMIYRYELVNNAGLVSIVAPNCNAFVIVDLALNMLGYASVPFFQALTSEARNYILEETEVTTVIGTNQDIINLLQSGSIAEIKNLVCFQPITEELISLSKQFHRELVLIDFWEELHKHDEQSMMPPLTAPGVDTLFTISYTSGTTGVPKGACITNGNIIAAVRSQYEVEVPSHEDCLISYLPYAHIFGRLGIYIALHNAMRIGHWRNDPKKLVEDMQILQPTMIPMVPRIMNKIYDKVMNGVAETTPAKRTLFRKALNSKVQNLRANGHFTHVLYDKLVFNKLKAIVGGKAKYMVSGGAPIARDVLQFGRVSFQCHFYEGYAQTESSASAFITRRYQNRVGHVGGPTIGTQFKLQDIPELNYYSSDKPYPRGEILVRGPCVFREYYKQPYKTAEALDEDGWLHSGDVGMLIEGNALCIIDRKKHIFKLSQGEYIAPQRLERILETCSLIAQIFIHGDSLKDHIVAVIVPDQEMVQAWAMKNGISGDYETICASKELHDAIEIEANQVAKDQGLNSMEKIKGNFIIESEPWTDKDLLTSILKLKRHQALQKYEAQLSQLYAQ